MIAIIDYANSAVGIVVSLIFCSYQILQIYYTLTIQITAIESRSQ